MCDPIEDLYSPFSADIFNRQVPLLKFSNQSISNQVSDLDLGGGKNTSHLSCVISKVFESV